MTKGSNQVLRTIKVHYRKAVLVGDDQSEVQGDSGAKTFENHLKKLMQSSLGRDVRERVISFTEDGQHSGCLHYTASSEKSFCGEVLHLDGRRVLPKWVEPSRPRPIAEIIPTQLADNEKSLGEPVYVMVIGNHVAAIERIGFRNSQINRYFNGLLQKAKILDNCEWRLDPKTEVIGSGVFSGKVKRVVVKPAAVLMGDAPSEISPQDIKKRSLRRAASLFDDLSVYGHRIINMLKAIGADEAKIENLRKAMSEDLVIKAKLELSVSSAKRGTSAEMSPAVINQALAELASDAKIQIVSEDGKSDGELVQLYHKVEVAEVDGRLDWDRVSSALLSAITAWTAKGMIELEP